MRLSNTIKAGLAASILAGALAFFAHDSNAAENIVTTNKPHEMKINWRPSKNFYVGRKEPIRRIIIHSTEGMDSLRWMTQDNRCEASTHYMVDKYGDFFQMVKDKDAAWQAGKYANQSSLGIEVEGFASRPGFKFNDVQYTNTARLALKKAREYGLSLNDVVSHDWVRRNLGGTSHTDPGPSFDWERFREILYGLEKSARNQSPSIDNRSYSQNSSHTNSPPAIYQSFFDDSEPAGS